MTDHRPSVNSLTVRALYNFKLNHGGPSQIQTSGTICKLILERIVLRKLYLESHCTVV